MRNTYVVQTVLKNSKASTKRLHPIIENAVFDHIVGSKEKYFGIDGDKNLWIWGDPIYGLFED